MFSFGGSSSGSSSRGKFNQEVFNPNAWNQFYGNANQMFQQMQPFGMMGFNMLPYMQGNMSDIYDRAGPGVDHLMGGGSYGDTTGLRDDLYSSYKDSLSQPSNMSRMYEDIVGGPGNTYVDPLIDSMRTAGDERRRTMHGATGLDAAVAGQGGSSRHAMENAMTNRMIDQDMNLAENQLRERNYDRDMGWKMNIARLADDNRIKTQEMMRGDLQGSDQNVGAGLSYLPNMQNLNMGFMAPWMQAYQMPWMGMQNYAGVMGDPTVLSSGKTRGKSSSGGIGFGIG